MMLRNHVVRRSLDYMGAADTRRQRAIESGNLEDYKSRIRNAVLDVHGILPAGPGMERRALKSGGRLCDLATTLLPILGLCALATLPIILKALRGKKGL